MKVHTRKKTFVFKEPSLCVPMYFDKKYFCTMGCFPLFMVMYHVAIVKRMHLFLTVSMCGFNEMRLSGVQTAVFYET